MDSRFRGNDDFLINNAALVAALSSVDAVGAESERA